MKKSTTVTEITTINKGTSQVEKRVYLVAIDRTIVKTVAIEAESKEEAEKAVNALLENGEIDMDKYDFFDPGMDAVECVEILPQKIKDVANPAVPVEIKTDAKGRRWQA